MNGIYVHIPFCAAKCRYCDFNSYAGLSEYRESYISALCKEISEFEFAPGSAADTVYFGGGTPTICTPGELGQALDTIRARTHLDENCEITLECNPGTSDYAAFKALRCRGFNRLSIGLQSADDKMLKTLGRIHTFEDFKTCFADARRAGFDNVSLDLIYGLPGQSLDNWRDTLKKAAAFGAEHISCYALKIEPGTPFADMQLDLPDDDAVGDMYDYAVEFLKQNGYNRYEISNFARSGFESRHNLKYWNCDDFAGFGAGAYSCVNSRRYSNIKSLTEYCKKGGIGCIDPQTEVVLTKEDKMSEFCFLGMRLERGISEKEFERRFDCRIDDIYKAEIEKNLSRGTLERKNGRIRIPDKWLFVSNSILVDFV